MADKKMFVTAYKGLELVHTPMGMKDKFGSKIPSVRCTFRATEHGYAYETSNPELIAWLEDHEYMHGHKIHAFDPKSILKVEPVEVSRGGVTAGTKEEPVVSEPSVGKNEPHKVKIRK